jgi:hypothetical protein
LSFPRKRESTTESYFALSPFTGVDVFCVGVIKGYSGACKYEKGEMDSRFRGNDKRRNSPDDKKSYSGMNGINYQERFVA